MSKKRSGIYQILCLDVNEKYVGASINLSSRKRQHFHELKHDMHRNPRLQRDYNLFGKRSFVFSILEIVDNVDILFDREQFWIDVLLPKYNAELKAGYSVSHVKKPEVRAKISQSMKEVWQDPEYRANYSKVRGAMPSNRKGVKLSEETKEKIRQANLGKNNPNYGKPRSESFLKKMQKIYDGAISPDGEIYTPIIGLASFCREFNLDTGQMSRLLNGKANSHKGWTRV